MNLAQNLAALRFELEQIDAAILTLQALAEGRRERRGRPPLWHSPPKGDKVSAAAAGADGSPIGKSKRSRRRA